MIRVFARKTKWTPTDDLAFFDGPPLYELPAKIPVYVSVTFTWDKVRGAHLANDWVRRFKRVRLGGPAFDDKGAEFVPGRFLKPGVTITSRGCPKNCPWCLVHGREGGIRELPIEPGHIVQDNSLLACSRDHIEAVFEMLGRQKKGAQFKGGLDIDYLAGWHVELLKKIRVSEIWVACDTVGALAKLDRAADLLRDFSIEKKRCYVLAAYEGDTVAEATRRCEKVYAKGFLPFVQLYQPGPDWRVFGRPWREFAWVWSKPAVYRSKKRKVSVRQ